MLCNSLQLLGKLESECVSGFFFKEEYILLCSLIFLILMGRKEKGKRDCYLLY